MSIITVCFERESRLAGRAGRRIKEKKKKNQSGPIVKRKKRGLQREPWHLIDHGLETTKDSSKMLFTLYDILFKIVSITD